MLSFVGAAGVYGNSPVTMTVNFIGISVYDFTADDITVVGGHVTDFVAGAGSLGGSSWTVTITPTGTSFMTAVVYGQVCSNALDHSILNMPSNQISWTYTRQWGKIAVSSVTPATSLGATPSVLTTSGSVVNAPLGWYKFAAPVSVCFTRNIDTQAVGTIVAGSLSMAVRVSGVSDFAITTNNVVTHYNSGDIIPITWSDSELAGSVKCIAISRDSWVTAAADTCSTPATFSLGLSVTAASIDMSCPGVGCSDNSRFFVGGISSIAIAATTTAQPIMALLSPSDVNAHFMSEYPPSPARPVFAQDSPVELLVLQRMCQGDVAGGSRFPDSWNTETVMTLRNTIVDVAGVAGLHDGISFRDVTSQFTINGLTTRNNAAWGTVVGSWGSSLSVSSVTWHNAECGVGYRKFILVKLSTTTSLSNSQQARFDLSAAIGGNSCGATAFVNPSPPLYLTLENDATRNDAGQSIAVRNGDSSTWMSSGASVNRNGIISLATGATVELSTSVPPATPELFITGVGNCIAPVSTNQYRFSGSRCTNIGTDFEAKLCNHGDVNAACVFDGLFMSSYMSSVTPGTSYTTNSGTVLLPSSENPVMTGSWQAVPFGSDTIFSRLVTVLDNGKIGAQYTFSGALADWRRCNNDDGSQAVTTTNTDTDIIYNAPVFFQRLAALGPLSARQYVQTQCIQMVVQMQGSSMTTTAQASTTSINAQITATSVADRILTGTVAQCGQSGYNYLGVTSLACNTAGALIKAVEIDLVVNINEVTNTATDGAICLLPPQYVPFAAIDPTSQTPSLESCYGVNPTGGAARLISSEGTMTSYMVSIDTPFFATNNLNFFGSCSAHSMHDDFSVVLTFMELLQPGVSCATAIAQQLPVTAYRLFRKQVISLKAGINIPATPTIFDTNTIDWNDVTMEMYVAPDYQDSTGAWHTSNGDVAPLVTSPEIANSYSVPLETNDMIVFTAKITDVGRRNAVQMKIHNTIVARFNLASPYLQCVDVHFVNPNGATCPTGRWAYLNQNFDYTAWVIGIAAFAPGAQNPIAASFSPIADSVPGITFAGNVQQKVLGCRYDVSSTLQKATPGSTAFYCGDTIHRCGDTGADFDAQALPGRVDAFWHRLSGLKDGGNTHSGQDGVAFPVSILASGSQYGVSMELVLHDCGSGSRRSLRALSITSADGQMSTTTISTIKTRGNTTTITVETTIFDTVMMHPYVFAGSGGFLALVTFIACLSCAYYKGKATSKKT